MANSAEKIARYLAGVTKESFLSNTQLQDAVAMNLIVIGEAARGISAETRENSSDIDWRGLRDLRNRIAHGYSTIDHALVWEAVEAHLPGLQARLTALVEEIDERP